jgi:hypothetical protein
MASKYVAPHARKGDSARDYNKTKVLEKIEANFPPLGAAAPPPNTDWNGKRKFASLAADWKAADDDEAQRRQANLTLRDRQTHAVVPRFCRIRPVMDEGMVEEEEDIPAQPQNPDDWTTIARKERKLMKPGEEAAYDADNGKMWGDQDESMWNTEQAEDYKTYWDTKLPG